MPTHHPLPIEPGRLRQLDPTQNSATTLVISDLAVVIDNAFPPDAAERRIRGTRKNDRVFDRNNRLVVITVQRPGLQLSAAEFAFVHEQVKRMFVVITLFADLAQRRTQFFERESGGVGSVSRD